MKQPTKLLLMSGIALNACLFSASAFAQSATRADDAGQRADANEEILVTARRTEESIQSVAVSATAFNGDALNSRSLEVRFQPIYEIREQRISGYEALVRWTHPRRRLRPRG